MKNIRITASLILALSVPALASECTQVASCLQAADCVDLGPVNGITVQSDYATRTSQLTGSSILVTRYQDTWRCKDDSQLVTTPSSGKPQSFEKTVFNVDGVYEHAEDAPLASRELALSLAKKECARQQAYVLATEIRCK